MHKVTLNVEFLAQADGYQGFAQLVIELPFAPTTDIEFEQLAWHNPRKAHSVSYNLNESAFFVHLGADKLPSKDDLRAHAETYRSSGWKVCLIG